MFEILKKRFTMGPILVASDLDKKMGIEVYLLYYAMGGVLLMECSDRQWRLVAYLSKSLNEIKRNYEIRRCWL